MTTAGASETTGTRQSVLELDAVVIGAGFGGMYALYKLRELGFSIRGFETGDDFGGTWYWNRYPGARCDVESLCYQYTFDADLVKGWEWGERYAAQPEIERYVAFVSDRLDLRKDFQFETRVTSATWEEEAARWRVETDRGDVVSARFVISAAGCLSARNIPGFDGVDSFEGETYHTGAWPKEGADLIGKRVGVIGTGSSGVQSIPEIAAQASHLYVFQRTANYSVPAGQTRLDPELQRERKEHIAEWRTEAMASHAGIPWAPAERSALEDTDEELRAAYDARWGAGGALTFLSVHNDVFSNIDANERVCDYARSKIRAIVNDPETAELLCPKQLPIGAKRFLVDTNYFETYNRDNVTLVDVSDQPIERITAKGLVTGGKEYELDVIVFATGYDAVTGPLMRIDIRGRNGLELRDVWKDGPRTYLGLQVAGFPNLFTITGPLSPSVLASMMMAIEQHVDWVADCLVHMREHQLDTIEAIEEAQDAWGQHAQEVVQDTVFVKANSWYLGANIPGKPRVFMPYVAGLGHYKERCDEVVANGYEGFELRKLEAPLPVS
jgi:cyclohexanone monooxygenase